MVFELSEGARESGVLAVSDVLVAHEQHLVLEQLRLDLAREVAVARGLGQADVLQFRAERAGEGYDLHLVSPFAGPAALHGLAFCRRISSGAILFRSRLFDLTIRETELTI